ncbi:hypothetical protein [Microcoleus sp. OTE_8_concoct_300]|uniref:hypothetical protein n=1 Tax=Microcoleus sp. OTE_8_concoct_300 TaxID=2964710 RepID=UPI00403FBD99
MQSIIELDLFFMQQGKVYQTLENLKDRLTRAGIDYAVIGGMALTIHGYVRATQDVDLLMTAEGLEAFRSSLVGRGFVPAFAGATKMFKDAATGVSVEIITAGEFPGDGKPKSVSFPDPAVAAVELDGIRVVRLTTLVELKLASGLTAPDRLKDLADVQELIRTLSLPESLAQEIDESVRPEYLKLWRSVQPRRE